jgi:predicted HTH domain antitoxin
MVDTCPLSFSNKYRKFDIMRTLVVHLPDGLDLDDREALLLLASGLYEKGKLTAGQAAALAGLSKRAFVETLSKAGVSIFNYPDEDLTQDLKNARNHHR